MQQIWKTAGTQKSNVKCVIVQWNENLLGDDWPTKSEYKVALASKLLIETDLSISEIGYECGYNSISFFHRQFSRFMKMSPGKYRVSYTSIQQRNLLEKMQL